MVIEARPVTLINQTEELIVLCLARMGSDGKQARGPATEFGEVKIAGAPIYDELRIGPMRNRQEGGDSPDHKLSLDTWRRLVATRGNAAVLREYLLGTKGEPPKLSLYGAEVPAA